MFDVLANCQAKNRVLPETSDDYLSYNDRKTVVTKAHLDKALEAAQQQPKTKFLQLRTFPKVAFQRRGKSGELKVQLRHQLHPMLMSKTALHQETLARLGLLRKV